MSALFGLRIIKAYRQIWDMKKHYESTVFF